MTAHFRRYLPAIGLLAALLRASSTHAEEAREAHALFRQGRALADGGHYTEACPKFEASLKIDVVMGTEFHLADCWEHTGRTRDAAALFAHVADEAHLAGQDDREQAARARALRLEPSRGDAPAARGNEPHADEPPPPAAASATPPAVVVPMVVEADRPTARELARLEIQAEYGRLAELDVEVHRIDALARSLAAEGPHDPKLAALKAQISSLQASLGGAWSEAHAVTVQLGRQESRPRARLPSDARALIAARTGLAPPVDPPPPPAR
jgi:hypothetical protein